MNKLITVYLSREDITAEVLEELSLTAESLNKDIENNKQYIYTTQTHAISNYLYFCKGYDIKIVSHNRYVLISDLLKNKEIRDTQNWEKMLYAGCFDLII